MVCRDQRLATGFGDNVVMFIIHDDDVHIWEISKGVMHMVSCLYQSRSKMTVQNNSVCLVVLIIFDLIQLVHTAGIHGIMNVMPWKAILSIRKYHKQMELAT